MLYFAQEKQAEKPSKRARRDAELGVATRVLRLRVKDKHDAVLKADGKEVNVVWNDTQDLGLEVLAREGGLVWAFEVAGYTKGAGKEGLTLHSQTIQEVSEEYVLRRKQFGREQRRWGAACGSKRSIGGIPVKAAAISYKNGQLHYQDKMISLGDSYGLSNYERRSGCLSEDARGVWDVNIKVEKKVKKVGEEENVNLRKNRSGQLQAQRRATH